MKQKPMKAYAYCRYSSHNQDDGWSIEAQKSAISKYAKANNIRILEYFIDEAHTGRNRNRPGYIRLMDAVEQGGIELLLVHKLNRMHRDAANQLQDFKQLGKLGIRLIAIADDIDTADPSATLLATIKAALAEQYSVNLALETRKGLIEAAKCGLHCGGTPPFGFRLGDDKRLIIDEATAPAVRQIFAMYLADMGYTAILDWLADHNYHTAKGNAFTKGALNAILTNEKYAGIYVYDKTAAKDENGMRNSHRYKDDYIRIEGGCPAIIPQEDFERAQEKLKNRSEERHNYNSKHYYPLNGKIWDADNDVRYSGNTNHSNGHRYFQYRSAQSGVRSVRAEALEEAVFYAMRELLLSEKNMERLLPLLNAYADDIHEQSEQERITLKNKRTALESKRNHLLASIEQGNAPQSIVDRISELENEIETLNHQLDSAETAPQVFTLNDMKKLKKAFIPYLQKHNTLEARHLIDNTIDTIQIGTDMIDIRFLDGITASRQTAAFFNNQI